MFLEVIADDKAFLEVRVKVILDLLCASEQLPMRLLPILLIVEEADGVGDELPHCIHIFQFPALDKKLHLVSKGLVHEGRRGLMIVRFYHCWYLLDIC